MLYLRPKLYFNSVVSIMTNKPSAMAWKARSLFVVPGLASFASLLAFSAASVACLITTSAANAAATSQTLTPAANNIYVYSEDALMEEVPGEAPFNGQRYYFGAMYNHLDSPLVENNADQTGRALTLIDNMNTLDLSVGYQPWRPFMIALNLPFSLVDQLGSYNLGLGDIRLEARFRLTAYGRTGSNRPRSRNLRPFRDQLSIFDQRNLGRGHQPRC